MEWLIRKLPPYGIKECLDLKSVGIVNRETGSMGGFNRS